MSRLILACVLISSATLLAPTEVVSYFGPSVQTFAWKLRAALDFASLAPTLRQRGH